MRFIVVDRGTLERGILVKTPYVIISIRDPGRRKPRIRKGAGLRGVLSLAFDDWESAGGAEPPEAVKPMTPEDAASIWQFVEAHLQEIGAIVCQCEEGLSRAPAIAAALAEALGEDADAILAEGDPNRHVYQLMAAAWSVRTYVAKLQSGKVTKQKTRSVFVTLQLLLTPRPQSGRAECAD